MDSFSPRNGEVILKAKAGDFTKVGTVAVSVPVMGK